MFEYLRETQLFLRLLEEVERIKSLNLHSKCTWKESKNHQGLEQFEDGLEYRVSLAKTVRGDIKKTARMERGHVTV